MRQRSIDAEADKRSRQQEKNLSGKNFVPAFHHTQNCQTTK